MRVALVAAAHLAIVRLVASVNVRVLLPVGAVGKSAIATLEFALERFLAWSIGVEKSCQSVICIQIQIQERGELLELLVDRLRNSAEQQHKLN